MTAPTTATITAIRNMINNKTDSTWRAGNGAATVQLPDGNLVWLFGQVLRSGASALHNAILVQDAATVTVPDSSGPAIPDDSDGSYFWPVSGVWDGKKLQVFAMHLEDGGGGAINSLGTTLATFRLNRLNKPEWERKSTITGVSDTEGIQWGHAVCLDDSQTHTYVYGLKARGGLAGRDIYVARAPLSALVDRSRWRYWAGSTTVGWVRDETRARVIETAENGRFGGGFSVDRSSGYRRGRFVVVSKDTADSQILVMFASGPMGPFVTSMSLTLTDDSPALYSYGARGHEELPLDSGKYLITWNWGSNNSARYDETQFPKPVCWEISSLGEDTALHGNVGQAVNSNLAMSVSGHRVFMGQPSNTNTAYAITATKSSPVTLVRHADDMIAAGSSSKAVSLGGTPTSGNLLVVAVGADKNAGGYTITGGGFSVARQDDSSSTSVWVGWKVSAGTESSVTVNRTGGNSSGGDNIYYAEYSCSSAGSWTLDTAGSNYTNETDVTSCASGNATPSIPGLALAVWSIDTVNRINSGTDSYTNGYTVRKARADNDVGTSGGGCLVADKNVPASATTSSTVSFTGTADQMSGCVSIFGKA